MDPARGRQTFRSGSLIFSPRTGKGQRIGSRFFGGAKQAAEELGGAVILTGAFGWLRGLDPAERDQRSREAGL